MTNRRVFLVSAIALTTAMARAQETAMPTIGFIRSTPSAPFAHLVTAFQQGLNETGFVEGQNVKIEYRWADNHLDRLPSLVGDLIRRQLSVIVGNSQAAEAAKTATATIPIVFVTGDDPVTRGLVDSLSRPSGNVTGITFFGGQLGAKRLELLVELAPMATVIAFLMDPNCGDPWPSCPTWKRRRALSVDESWLSRSPTIANSNPRSRPLCALAPARWWSVAARSSAAGGESSSCLQRAMPFRQSMTSRNLCRWGA